MIDIYGVGDGKYRIKVSIVKQQLDNLKRDTSGDIVWYNNALIDIKKDSMVATTGIVDIYVIDPFSATVMDVAYVPKEQDNP